MNNDGKLDAVASSGADGETTVSVLLGQGNGVFGAKTDLTAGARPFEVAGGDFNGDTKIDLATTNGDDGTISVFPRQRRRNLRRASDVCLRLRSHGQQPPARIAQVGGPQRRRKARLFVGNTGDKKIVSMINAGDGTFSNQNEILTGGSTGPGNIIGDFNSDSKTDVAYNLGTSTNLIVHFGVGDGTFGSAQLYSLFFVSGTFATGDGLAAGVFNGDGKTDIFMVTTAVQFRSFELQRLPLQRRRYVQFAHRSPRNSLREERQHRRPYRRWKA